MTFIKLYKLFNEIITLFSGVQMLSLGIVGEYIARINDVIKGRPLYIIKSKINIEDNIK